MKSRSVGANLAILFVFVFVGLTMFSDGVRTVQIIGLLACGAAAGAALTRLIVGLRSRTQSGS
ncbi:MAG TPA: hypothetical protein VL126_01060 [Bacteroidota bacterium]|nr:hypothetical protein [Bacteroidota bacterium]